MDELRVRLLGGLEVEGLDYHAVGSRKARLLLKALALAGGKALSVDRLADIVWGEDLPSRPSDQVGVLVSRLRGSLGPDRIIRGDAGYALRADWIDVAELESRVDEAAARLAAGSAAAAGAAAVAALALARGPLLPDDDGEWIEPEREATSRLVGRARVLAAEAALAAGDRARAASEAESALDHDPYDEVALRLAMTALAELGRPASALALYARVRTRLVDDLGVSPSDTTEALHTAVLMGDVRPVSPASTPPTESLVGRDRELAELDRSLLQVRDGGTAMAVVRGEAGIGKTALVMAWATALEGTALVIHGRCEPAGRALPLQPIVDGVESYLRKLAPDAVREALGGDAVLVSAVLGRAPTAELATPAGPTDGGAQQAVVYGSLLSVLERAAGERPVIVVVEDVHHAGPSTLEWLHFALRRGQRLLVVVTYRVGEGPRLPEARTVDLGPLDLDAASALVGQDRAAELHARSGGNPLYLLQLAAAGGSLPSTIRDVITGRTEALGSDAAATLRAAAVLGETVDVDLLAGVLGCPVGDLLGHLEAGLRVRLLEDRGGAIGFTHDLIRDALAGSVTAARRSFVHRSAARALATRPKHDPLTVAWHAEQGGDVDLASAALVDAAAMAAGRYDLAAAETHLDDAVALADGPGPRLARARVRMLRWDLERAGADVDVALAAGADVRALELGGWIAYYRRDHASARRFADAALERAAEPAVRASSLVLAGRLRHATGDLAGADAMLTEAESTAPPGTRGLPRVWLASLRVHQGRAVEAHDLAVRSLLDPDTVAHPYASHYGLFADAHALGLLGRPIEALGAIERLETVLSEQGVQATRFVGVAANMKGWVRRSIGLLDAAVELHLVAVALPDEAPYAEPRYAGAIDLVEVHATRGDWAAVADGLDALRPIEDWAGTMQWHHRQRYHLMRARLALASGDTESAAELGLGVVHDMESRGAPRYAALGRAVVIRARAAGGETVDPSDVAGVLQQVEALAGMESWWVTAEVASATGVDRWWRRAEQLAGGLVAVAGPYADELASHVSVRLGDLRRRSR